MKQCIVALACTATLLVSGCSSIDKNSSDTEQTDTQEVSGSPSSEKNSQSEEDIKEKEETTVEAPVVNENGVIRDPDDFLALVNKEYHLPSTYEPEDLTVPDVPFPYEGDHPKKQLREQAALALERLFADAEEEGLSLYAISGYRSYGRQKTIFEANAAEDGEEAANQYSARPGESEHQTGLTMDVSSPSNDFALTTDFGETPEGKWLKENAHHYGFIIRYPADKTDITNYQYEPWHLRYVGKEQAATIYENDYTLEEYLGVSSS